MQIAIIQFPGSNCERETILAVQRAGMEPVEFLWNEPIEKLTACDGFIIVGGFSYEDRSRSGILAALDPVMSVIKTQVALGKPLLGICNGAQIIVESGLIGDAIALTHNKRVQNGKLLGTGYYNAWVNLTLAEHQNPANAFMRLLGKDCILKMPVAHAEGRFLIPTDILADLKQHGQIVFRYCNAQRECLDEFPVNPNGSIENIAAIANRAGNVMAIMPHPERTSLCDSLFHSMRDYISAGYQPHHLTDNAKQEKIQALPHYHKPQSSHELIVGFIIADNHALSVESALKKRGIHVSIKRTVHWEIDCQSESVFHKIQASQLLYNERKEFQVKEIKNRIEQKSFLVRPMEDWIGLQKQQQLQHYFDIDGIASIKQSILWHIQAAPQTLDKAAQQVLDSLILFNPISHECLHYE